GADRYRLPGASRDGGGDARAGTLEEGAVLALGRQGGIGDVVDELHFGEVIAVDVALGPGAEEDAAVGAIGELELQLQLEVGELTLRTQPAGFARDRLADERAVGHLPAVVAHRFPAGQVLAVEERQRRRRRQLRSRFGAG